MENSWSQPRDAGEEYFEKSRLIHNSLLDLHKDPLPSDFVHHRNQIAEIIARYNVEHYIQPHLAHSHFRLEEGEVMLGQAVQLDSDSDAPTPSAVRTAPTPVKDIINQAKIYPHVLGWHTDEKGVLHPFPYLYRIAFQRPPVPVHSSEALQLITDYVKEHRLQRLITLEFVEDLEPMIEFAFNSCVFSIDAAGVPDGYDLTETSWKVEKKDESVCIISLEKYLVIRGAHVAFPDDKEILPSQLFRRLKQEGVWDNNLWINRNSST